MFLFFLENTYQKKILGSYGKFKFNFYKNYQICLQNYKTIRLLEENIKKDNFMIWRGAKVS